MLLSPARAHDAARQRWRGASGAFRCPALVAAPEDLPLYLLEEGDFRGTASGVSCTQAIAGSGAFSLGMITDLEPTLGARGAWWYRWLHWEAGMIGQVLYLKAEAAGMSGTGIGCFLDDAVRASFGLTDESFHALYLFTMGRAVQDGRLTTLPPYDDERRALTTGST